jgi:hypothetical protein
LSSWSNLLCPIHNQVNIPILKNLHFSLDKEKKRLKGFKKMLLRHILWPLREEVTGNWRNEICIILVLYKAHNSSFIPTFQDNLSTPFSGVLIDT